MFGSTFQSLFSPVPPEIKSVSCGTDTSYNPKTGKCEVTPGAYAKQCGVNTRFDSDTSKCEVDVSKLFSGGTIELKTTPPVCTSSTCVNEDNIKMNIQDLYKNMKNIPKDITVDVITNCQEPSKSIKVEPKPKSPPRKITCTLDEATVFYKKCCPPERRNAPECVVAFGHANGPYQHLTIKSAADRLKKSPQKNKDLMIKCTSEEAFKDYKKCCTNYNDIINDKECSQVKLKKT